MTPSDLAAPPVVGGDPSLSSFSLRGAVARIDAYFAASLTGVALYLAAVYVAHAFWIEQRVYNAIYLAIAVLALPVAMIAPRFPWWTAVRRACHHVIRAGLAFIVLWYGVAKLMPDGGQFGYLPLIEAEKPFREVDPFWKAFGFFGHSPLYNAALAAAELVAAALVLSDRTVRLGLCLLVTILVNIAIVDYAFGIIVLDIALILLTMTLYLLACERRWLLAAFWSQAPLPLPPPASPSPSPPWLRRIAGVRLVGLAVIALGLAHLWSVPNPPPPPLYGTWLVEEPRIEWQKLYIDFELNSIDDQYGSYARIGGELVAVSIAIESREGRLAIRRAQPAGALFSGSFRIRDLGRRLDLTSDRGDRLVLRRVD